MLAFLVSAIRLGMTFLLGSTGETITEKSGHLNLGTPGVMCVGAACGCYAEYLYFKAVGVFNINPVVAVILPIFATLIGSALMGVIFCFLTVTLRVNQNVTGLALTTFGVGVSDFLIANTTPIFSKGSKYFTAHLSFADDLGWFGQIFLSHGILIYLAIIIALLSAFVLNKKAFNFKKFITSCSDNFVVAEEQESNILNLKVLSSKAKILNYEASAGLDKIIVSGKILIETIYDDGEIAELVKDFEFKQEIAMKNVGFKDMDIFLKINNFVGIIAIK